MQEASPKEEGRGDHPLCRDLQIHKETETGKCSGAFPAFEFWGQTPFVFNDKKQKERDGNAQASTIQSWQI